MSMPTSRISATTVQRVAMMVMLVNFFVTRMTVLLLPLVTVMMMMNV
jgi:hypothetical protein